MLRDHLPLQQGLRHAWNTSVKRICYSQRPSSITTRIKTLYGISRNPGSGNSLRPSSITTRIKTYWTIGCLLYFYKLREYLPLQQGLRLIINLFSIRFNFTPRVSSITTRIKTNQTYLFLWLRPSLRLSSITTRIVWHQKAPLEISRRAFNWNLYRIWP